MEWSAKMNKKNLSAAMVFLALLCLSAGRARSEDNNAAPGWYPQFLSAQFNGVVQDMPEFRSPYEGPNSLRFDYKSRSLTDIYGVYLGSQVLDNLQAYLDLEMFRGYGLSNGTGLGGITNGDVIRGSQNIGNDPYIARLYVRYIHALSAETAPVEKGMDQLPGSEPVSRVEVKAGRMAATDDFDNNRYANNTRTQFMNWAFINDTAWDFAANTRGYSDGIVVAWVNPLWRLAFGVYRMPTHANGIILDNDLTKANGDNLELTVKPGKWGTVARLLVYRNTGQMGDYGEAIAIGRSTGSIPNVIADELHHGRSKYGAGINLEQPIADDGETGAFFRAGWNDGHTEDFTFTEVDRQISLGLQISGVHWRREDDRIGIAYARHDLSSAHSTYLSLGGLGFDLGDGRLTYGTEQVAEVYYRIQLGRYVQLSPDFQFIKNPGYNRDRGPVEVYGMRLHMSI